MSARNRVSTRETHVLSEPLWHQSSTELTEQQRRLCAGSTDAHVLNPLIGPKLGDVAGGNGGVGGSDSHHSPCQNLSSPLVTPIASIPSQGNITSGVGRPIIPSCISEEGGAHLSIDEEILQDQHFADDVEDDVLLIEAAGQSVEGPHKRRPESPVRHVTSIGRHVTRRGKKRAPECKADGHPS